LHKSSTQSAVQVSIVRTSCIICAQQLCTYFNIFINFSVEGIVSITELWIYFCNIVYALLL